MKPKIIAYTPIKLNNERFPGKNIRSFSNGMPLCTYVLNTLKSIPAISDVYVFCSDEEIEDYLPKGVMRQPRSKELDGFQSLISDVCDSFTRAVSADIYVYAQVTSPFLSSDTITKGIKAVLSGEYDSAVSVRRIQDFLWAEGKPFNFDPANIARTQDLPLILQETGALYIYKRETMIDHKRRTGFNPCLIEVSEIEAIDIDYKEDFELAEVAMQHLNRR